MTRIGSNPVIRGGCLLISGRHLRIAVGRLPPDLLAFEFLRQFAFEASLFSGLEKKRAFLHLFDDAFLLNLSLETTKDALNGFALKNPDLCQVMPP
jgi:hypothetical protein